MKNFKSAVIGFCSLTTFIIVAMILAVDHFGPVAVERTFLIMLSVASWFLSRYFTRTDMYNGAKVVLASQESDDRRERAGLSAMSKFMNSVKGSDQPALPAPNGDTTEDELIFEDADFSFADAEDDE